MTDPTVAVSVIIPAYNAAPFIGETLESVLTQSFTDREVVVINDGSPDTAELERVLAPYRGRIVYLKQENTGPSGARNHAIREARGTWVALLDSDDLWMPGYLAAQMEILAADPSIDLLYSNGVIIGDGPLTGRDLMSVAPSRGAVTFESLVGERCTVLTSCVVARRQALIDAGLFDVRFRRSEDFHLWARLAFRGARIRYHRRVLVRHRRREGSLSDDRGQMARAAVAALRDLAASLPLTGRQRALVRSQAARYEAYAAFKESKQRFLADDYAGAAEALGRACALEPGRGRQVRLRALQAGMYLAPRLMRRWYGFLRGPQPGAVRSVS